MANARIRATRLFALRHEWSLLNIEEGELNIVCRLVTTFTMTASAALRLVYVSHAACRRHAVTRHDMASRYEGPR